MNKNNSNPLVSIILPCRNEEKSLEPCLNEILKVLHRVNAKVEIIVSDSSTDNSEEIAKGYNVVLHKHDKVGYGIALMEGISISRGKYIFFADADMTYDFHEIPRFIGYLEQGYDFVIGNRFKGKIKKGAMPWLHKNIGNPLLSKLTRFLFKTSVGDVHCGMRAIRRSAYDKLKLQTIGMEFASEMVVKVKAYNLRTKELSISYSPRQGESKLNTFSDGWRHLRFLLLYSPLYIFFVPGIILIIFGAGTFAWLYFFNPTIFGITFYFHPLIFSTLMTVFGYQLIFFALFARTYAMTHLNREDKGLQKFYKFYNLEKGIILSLIFGLLGAFLFGVIIFNWINSGYGELDQMKNFLLALIFTLLGLQTVFSSFMLSILSIKEK